MKCEIDPIVAWFLIADSSSVAADRFVADPGPGYWARRMRTDVQRALDVGCRRLAFRGPFGHSLTDEPNSDLSYRADTFAQLKTPWLINGFVDAFLSLRGKVDQVIFYLGSLRTSSERMKGPDAAALITNTLKHLSLFRQLKQAGLPVVIANDSCGGFGQCEKAYWPIIEYLHASGLPQMIEGPGAPGEPRQLKFDSFITEQMWAQRNDALGEPMPWWAGEDDIKGAVVRVCDDFAVPAPVRQAGVQSTGQGPKSDAVKWYCWGQAQHWVPGWIDQAVAAGYSVAINADHIAAAGLRAERWRRVGA